MIPSSFPASIPITLIVAAATNAEAFTRLAQRLSDAGEIAQADTSDNGDITELPSRDDARALLNALRALGFSDSIRDRVWIGLWGEYTRDGGAPIALSKGVKLLPEAVVDATGESRRQKAEIGNHETEREACAS